MMNYSSLALTSSDATPRPTSYPVSTTSAPVSGEETRNFSALVEGETHDEAYPDEGTDTDVPLTGQEEQNHLEEEDTDSTENSSETSLLGSLLVLSDHTQALQKSEANAVATEPLTGRTLSRDMAVTGSEALDNLAVTYPAGGRKASVRPAVSPAKKQPLGQSSDRLSERTGSRIATFSAQAATGGSIDDENGAANSKPPPSKRNIFTGSPSSAGSSPDHGRPTGKHMNRQMKMPDLTPLANALHKGHDMLNIGDKIAIKNPSTFAESKATANVYALDRIDIISSRKQGDLTLLKLQMSPENLGTIDTKLRMDNKNLMVELTVDRQETARLLAKDQHLLMQTLEKAGLGDQTRMHVSIIERGGQLAQPATGISHAQNDAHAMGGSQAQNQSSFQENPSAQADEGREGENHKQPSEQALSRDAVLPEKKVKRILHAAPGASHRLII